MTFVDHSTDALAQAPAHAPLPSTITTDSPPTKPVLVPLENPQPQQQPQQQPQPQPSQQHLLGVPMQPQPLPVQGQFVQMPQQGAPAFVSLAPQLQQQPSQQPPQFQQQQFHQFQQLQQPQVFLQQQQPPQQQQQHHHQPQQVYVMGPDGTLTPQLLQQPMYVLPAQQPQPQTVILASTAPPAYAGLGGAAGRQVIVNFLAPEVNNADLAGVFQSIGPIDSARVIVDKVTGVSKQFGFVYFQRPEDAVRAAQELTGFPMMGRRIKVTIATTQRPQ